LAIIHVQKHEFGLVGWAGLLGLSYKDPINRLGRNGVNEAKASA